MPMIMPSDIRREWNHLKMPRVRGALRRAPDAVERVLQLADHGRRAHQQRADAEQRGQRRRPSDGSRWRAAPARRARRRRPSGLPAGRGSRRARPARRRTGRPPRSRSAAAARSRTSCSRRGRRPCWRRSRRSTTVSVSRASDQAVAGFIKAAVSPMKTPARGGRRGRTGDARPGIGPQDAVARAWSRSERTCAWLRLTPSYWRSISMRMLSGSASSSASR